jgi:hypothetical protein
VSEIDEGREPGDVKSLFAWSKEGQRNIEFILRQQAKFSAGVERVQEIQARTARVVDELATVSFRRFQGVEGDVNDLDAKMAALVDSHIRLSEAQERGEGKMDALADSHIRLSDAHERLESKMDALPSGLLNPTRDLRGRWRSLPPRMSSSTTPTRVWPSRRSSPTRG